MASANPASEDTLGLLRESIVPDRYVHGLFEVEEPDKVAVEITSSACTVWSNTEKIPTRVLKGLVRYNWVKTTDDRLGVPANTRVSVDFCLDDAMYHVYNTSARLNIPAWAVSSKEVQITHRSLVYIEHPELFPFRWPGTF